MELLDYKKICSFEDKQVTGQRHIEIIFYNDSGSEKVLSPELLVKIQSIPKFESGVYFQRSETDHVYVYPIREVNFSKLIKATKEAISTVKSLGFDCFKIAASGEQFKIMLYSYIALYEYSLMRKDAKKCIPYYIDSGNAKEAAITGMYCNFATFMGDCPANLMTPVLFVEYAQKMVSEIPGNKSVMVEVYDEKYIIEQRMNVFYSVAQGSIQPPRLLVLKYRGKYGDTLDVCLVGKGVTFDSGGISLKASAKMAEMKKDMLGAASCIAAFLTTVSMGVEVNIDVVIPLTENMPSRSATKPGDVFVSLDGTSVEVDNTDAEGRLILCDSLTFAQQSKPKYLIDVATLTGAMVVALGKHYVGMYSNCDALSDGLLKGGCDIGSPLWRMPLDSRYVEDMSSTVADIKNVGTGGGGACMAAGFLQKFINEGQSWAHLDIAGVMNEKFNMVPAVLSSFIKNIVP